MEGQGCFYGRAGPFLWKGRTIFMEGQGGSKFDLAIQKLLIPGMGVRPVKISNKYRMLKYDLIEIFCSTFLFYTCRRIYQFL